MNTNSCMLLTCSVAYNTNIFTVTTVVIGSVSAVHQPALISNTGHIIQKDWATSLAIECRATDNSIYNKYIHNNINVYQTHTCIIMIHTYIHVHHGLCECLRMLWEYYDIARHFIHTLFEPVYVMTHEPVCSQ